MHTFCYHPRAVYNLYMFYTIHLELLFGLQNILVVHNVFHRLLAFSTEGNLHMYHLKQVFVLVNNHLLHMLFHLQMGASTHYILYSFHLSKGTELLCTRQDHNLCHLPWYGCTPGTTHMFLLLPIFK